MKEHKHINALKRRVAKTLYKYNMIQSDDKILVGLSGGKDSLVMLDILHDRRKYIPFNYNLVCAFVYFSNIGYRLDQKYLQRFCKERNIELIIVRKEMSLETNSKKSPCFICSWHRRKELFHLTKKHNCNKLALGHNLDDAIETLFINMVYHGSISSLPEKLKMFEGRIEVIRPLLFQTEKDIKQYSEILDFKTEEKLCPYSKTTKRDNIKKMINEFDKMHYQSKINIFRSMDNIYKEYLPTNFRRR